MNFKIVYINRKDMHKLPKARTADILEQAADQDLLIYDLRTNQAYNLNETSKIIYQACGKQLGFDELKRRSKFDDDIIYFALEELAANDLLEGEVGNHFGGLSRREVIRRVGTASMIALPVISSLIAPNAVNAASSACPAGNITVGGTTVRGRGETCQCDSNPGNSSSCNTTIGGQNGANSCRSGCVCNINQPSNCTGNSCLGTCS